jgi:fibronectin-binding autotransporter adhesin
MPKSASNLFALHRCRSHRMASLVLAGVALPHILFGQTVTDAGNLETTLNTSATPGTINQTITFGNSISIAGYSAPGYNAGSGFLGAINAPTVGGVLSINGNGNSLTGGSNALFFASPENETATGGVANPTAQFVAIDNLTISGATSLGGNSVFGGGGAGMGGGLFVGTGVHAKLYMVDFNANQAVGGSSIYNSSANYQDQGGSIGGNSSATGVGGSGLYAIPTALFSGGGANGGQGLNGGSGGFGGGGAFQGGAGGFAASGSLEAPSGFGAGSSYDISPAGFGGGAGYDALTIFPASAGIGGGTSGGGGAGFGGAVFVQSGAELLLTGNDTLAGDTATGGAGNTSGAGVGNEIFMMTGSSVTLAPGTGSTVTIGAAGDTGDNIADDSASSLPAGQSYLQGTAAGAGLVLGLAGNPGGTIALYGNNTYQGGTTLQNGVTLIVGSSHALGTGTITMMDPTMVYLDGDNVANPIVLMGDTTLEVDNTDSATQSGAISESGGSYGITKTGTGTLALTSANTYTGATYVDFGTLSVSGNGSITQTSAVSVGHASGSDGTLTVTGTSASLTGTGLVIVGDQGTGALNVENGGTVNLGVDNNNVGLLVGNASAVTGTTTVTGTGSSLTVNSGTGDMVLGNGGNAFLNIIAGGTVTDGSAFLGEGSTAAAGTVDVSGSGSAWTNNNTLYLGEGGTGTVTVEDNGSISASSIVIGDQSPAVGTLKIGNNNAVGSLTIGSIQFGNGAGTIDFNQTNTATLNANISGAGTVNIEGSGTTILGGNSSYTGTTTISAGTVEMGSSSALGASDVVFNGGTFTTTGGGTGVQVNLGGNYTQAAGTTLALNVYGPNNYDSLNLTTLGGVATVHGTLMLNLVGGFAPGSGENIAVITTNNPVVGQFSTVLTSLPSIGVSANYTDDVTVLFQRPFASLPGVGLTPNQLSVATYIDRNDMTSTNPAFNSVVAALNSLSVDPNALAGAFDQLSPQAFGQFSTATAFNNASFETEAMDNYLANQRGADGNFLAGNGTVDASGLVVNDPSYDPNLAMIHSRMLAWNPAPNHGVITDVPGSALGGVEMQPALDPNSLAPQNGGKPWNVFVRGDVVLSQGSSTQDVSHFDDHTESVVVGVDYRITPDFLVGLTGGYGHTDATLDNNGSSATVDSYSPGLYASYADKGWYANLSGSYVFNNYTQDRLIGFLGQTAHSAPHGNEGVANLDGGYDFRHGAWTFGPLAGLQYTHLSVDGYDESGSAGDLSVNEQDANSLRSRLGGRVSFAFVDDGIHFTPHLDVSWQHEFMDQSRGITSQFDGAGLGSFSVQTTEPSRDSALVGAGLDADLNGTVTVFGDYEVQAGQENYFGQSIQGGVKIGF